MNNLRREREGGRERQTDARDREQPIMISLYPFQLPCTKSPVPRWLLARPRILISLCQARPRKGKVGWAPVASIDSG